MSTLHNLDGIHNTLVDINGTLKYFESIITISPSAEDSGKTYKVGIVSQDELDSGNITTKDVVGSHSMNLVNNTGDFQNFFLYLYSSEPMKNIDVNIKIAEVVEDVSKRPVPPTPNPVPVQPAVNNHLYIKLVIALLVVIIGVIMLRRFYKESS